MNTRHIQVLFISAALVMTTSCDDESEGGAAVNDTLNGQVITDFANNLPVAVYGELSTKTTLLHDQVLALVKDGPTQDELTAAQTTWREARHAWEQSEAFLFGPVSTENIDPRIDTWPVNFTDLDEQLASEAAFTEDYINSLDDALKGFHPVEYLIFGQGGTKKAADFNARQLEYLTGLSLNLKKLTGDLAASWSATAAGSYHAEFSTAGDGSNTVYPTQRAALEEMINAMAGICDEVANGKITEPYEAKDANLEESPFAKNSFADFKNNITGVRSVYMGQYGSGTDGKGIEDLVKSYNLQLDIDIKSKMSAAISSFDAFGTTSFGTAITTDGTKIQNTVSAINDLKTTLEEQLLPFVIQHSK